SNVVEREIGEKSEPAQVDPQQRDLLFAERPARPQDRAVPSQHDRQVDLALRGGGVLVAGYADQIDPVAPREDLLEFRPRRLNAGRAVTCQQQQLQRSVHESAISRNAAASRTARTTAAVCRELYRRL